MWGRVRSRPNSRVIKTFGPSDSSRLRTEHLEVQAGKHKFVKTSHQQEQMRGGRKVQEKSSCKQEAPRLVFTLREHINGRRGSGDANEAAGRQARG